MDKTSIEKMFYGMNTQIMNYQEGVENKCKTSQVVYGPINVEVRNKDLYNAWEVANNQHIDHFKNEAGEIVEAQKEFFANSSPDILQCVINRLHFDKEKKGNSSFLLSIKFILIYKK